MCSSYNHGVNVVRKFYAPLLSSDNWDNVFPGTEFESVKIHIIRHKMIFLIYH